MNENRCVNITPKHITNAQSLDPLFLAQYPQYITLTGIENHQPVDFSWLVLYSKCLLFTGENAMSAAQSLEGNMHPEI